MATPTRLILEFEPDADLPSGTLRNDAGHQVTFSGWLGLAGALEEALSAPVGDVVASPSSSSRCPQRP